MPLDVNVTGHAVRGLVTVRSEVVGLDATEAALNRYLSGTRRALAGALYREAEAIITDSKTVPPKVPVDTGTLRGTGHAALPVVEGNLISVEAGYGGPAAP